MRWLRWLVGTRQIDRDIAEEIQQHVEEKIAELVSRGMSTEEASYEAERVFGNVALIEERSREVWGWPLLDSLWSDGVYSVRQLRRSPGFALTVVATLAAGIAASIAMFAVIDRVLLRPLPYNNSSQLIEIKESGNKGVSAFGAPYMDLREWYERSHTLKNIAFHTYDKPTSFLEGVTGPVQINTPKVSANLFATLGVPPALGRVFTSESSDNVSPADARTAVLSDAVWRDGFGADGNILGRAIRINGNSYTVIGVMPRGFQFPFNTEKPQIWIPIQLGDSDKRRAKNETPEYRIIARLSNEASIQAANAELKTIQVDVAKQYTDAHARENVTSVELRAYSDSIVEGGVKKALLLLLAAAGVLWLIACINVTSLLLARAAARQREIAVRAALGASHWRIARQLVVEGLVMSCAAGALGVGLAYISLRLFHNELTSSLNFAVTVTLNIRLTCCLLGLSLLSAVASSAWPAIVAARAAIDPALRQGSVPGSSKSQHRVRRFLVVTQVAMSLTLLVACGLLLRTIFAMKHIPLGFQTDHVIVADMVIPSYKFAGRNMTAELYQPLAERVDKMPGVEAAALTTAVPLGRRFPILFEFAADERDPESVRLEDLVAQFRAVGPGLQKVLGFRMLAGRFFDEGDTAGSAPVVVVNRAFARDYFADHRDLSKVVGEELVSYGDEKMAHIIGVLDDERQASVLEQSKPEIQVCIPQITPKAGFYQVTEGLAMNLLVRTPRDPGSFIPELRETMRSASAELAGSTFTTLDQVVDNSLGDQRTAARLLQVFSGAALLLSLTGLYGLLVYFVAQRTRELGVRLALGAQRGQIVWLVVRQAGEILFAGSVIGLALSYFATRMLASLLYGVKPYDGITLTVACGLLVGAGLAAAYLPARRAAGLSPIEVLRAE